MRQYQLSMKRIGLALASVLIGAFCLMPMSQGFAQASAPALASVQPDRAANDVDTPVEILGSGFSNEGSLPQVFLGAAPLTQVAWVNESTLTAQVPWGIEAGVYSLRVVNPDGAEVTLDSAFEVTQGVGQWNSNAIDGGPVNTVIPIANTAGLLYAYSGATSAVYRSADYGEHWATVGHASGQFFTYDAAEPVNLYLNTLQSTDGGVTWHDMLEGGRWPGLDERPGGYTQVFPHPSESGTLFLAAAGIPASSGEPSGLLRSEDSGLTWESVETGLLSGDTHVTAMAFSGNTIYLGTRDGNLYQSNNVGASWQRIGSASVLPSIGILKVNPYEPTELWVTTHFSVTANARILKMDLGDPLYAVTQVSAWPEASYPKTMGFLAEDAVFIGSHWDNGWITEDDGDHWNLFQPSTGKPGYWLALDPWDTAQNAFYIADEQYGVQKTSDRGATWAPINQGLHAMSPDYLNIDPANPARVYAKITENGWPGIFVSDDGGQNWNFSSLEPASSGTRPVVSMLATNAGRVFAGAHGNDVFGYGPQLYISEDQGSSWERHNIDTAPLLPSSFHMPGILQVDPQHNNTLLMTVIIGDRSMTTDEYVSEIYRSTDNGEIWQRVNLTAQVGHPVNNLKYLAFDPHNPDMVYASSHHEILKSTDNGITWSAILTDSSAWLGGPIAIEPVAPYRVYVGDRVSSDGGETWDPAYLPIGANAMVFVSGSDTLYIAGDGLAYSHDGGTTWQTPEGPLATSRINALAIGRRDQRTVIYIGTPGGDTPESNPTFAALNAANLSSLEAGVYRMTEVNRNVFLPMVMR